MRARFKITDSLGNIRFLSVTSKRIQLVSKHGVPMSLSYITENPVELKWALEEAKSETAAKAILDRMVSSVYKIAVYP